MRQIRRSSVFALPASILASLAAAQSHTDWIAQHDGAPGQADYGRACAVDSLGSVIVAGRSYNPTTGVPPMPPSADFEVVKFGQIGVQLWSARLDLASGDEYALDVQCDAANDVYVCGYTWAGSNIELALVKWSSAGALQWSRTYGGAGGGSDFARAIAFDAVGNVIVCGHEYGAGLNNDALVRSYSPSGALNWSTSFDAAGGDDTLYALTVLPSGEILACGQFTNPSSGGANAGIAKLSATGTLLWQRNDDGGGNLSDGVSALAVVDASRVLVGGWRSSATGEDWLISLCNHVTQNVEWTRTFNGSSNANDRVRSVARDTFGVLWVAGSAANSGAGIDFATRRYDASGNLLSSDVWNNVGLDDQPFKAAVGNAGQVYVTGSTTLSTTAPTNVDVAVIQYDKTGARNWVGTYSTPGSYDDRIFDAELVFGSYMACGGYTSSLANGGYDFLALQVNMLDSPKSYCSAKTNSLGCAASMTFTGLASVAHTSGFVVEAAPLRNQKSGLFFYSTLGAANAPFQGGTFCVRAPTRRGPLLSSGGNAAPADDCSGAIAMDWNAFAHGLLGGGVAPELLTPGTDVYCQVWSRDPGASFQTNLSSAMHFAMTP